MNFARTLTVGLFLASTGPAAADCPFDAQDLPPTGFLASATRLVMEGPDAVAADSQPTVTAQVSAAGGVRADGAGALGTASAAAQVLARGKGLTGCVSGDLVDVREGAAHVTASAQFPVFFTGMSVGFSLDRQVQLPLATRPEYLRAPLSRIAGQFSVAFIDIPLTDKENHLRVMVMPFTVEQARESQNLETSALDRHTTEISTSMFRFVADEPGATGGLDVFRFDASWIDPDATMAAPIPGAGADVATGFVRISPVAFTKKGDRWSYALDGGWLGLAGPVDCKTARCYRGFYLGSLGHAWEHVAVEARAERTAFMSVDDEPAFEDRVSATGSVEDESRHASVSAFGARSAAWTGDHVVHRTGVRTTLSQQLSRGFSAVLDGELARADAGATMSLAQDDARLLVSIAWQAHAAR